MDAGDDNIEPRKNIVRVIELAVIEYVDFGAIKMCGDKSPLSWRNRCTCSIFFSAITVETASDALRWRVIRHCDVLGPEIRRMIDHLFDGAFAIRQIGVGVKIASAIIDFDQRRPPSHGGRFDFAAVFPKLGCNDGHSRLP